ncbi:MAG: hypothetical protein Ta2E_03770 [Mycoplasmoidaceae bacterium]|nr:MAG: hypothetical protein Ta2E_03770 [Mycoplasmoidaceae bacterium]
MNSISTLSGLLYNQTQTTGLIDSIVDGVLSVFNGLLVTLLQPALWFIYQVIIWVPLQVINALVILFKFFANGFANQIFGGQMHSNGSITYDFNFSSPLGQVMMYVLIIAFMLFFVYWIMGFVGGTAAGELKAIKWPLIMIIVLLITPIVFIIADTLMGALLSGMDGSLPQRLSSDEYYAVADRMMGSNGDFTKLTQISAYTGLGTTLASINASIDIALASINANINSNSFNFGIIQNYLIEAQESINWLTDYLSVGMPRDYGTVNDIINSWPSIGAEGLFLSEDNANAFADVSNNITMFQNYFKILSRNYDNLNNKDCITGWNTLINSFAFNKSTIMDPLLAIKDDIKVMDGNAHLGFFVGSGKSVTTGAHSLLSNVVSGGNGYPSLNSLIWYRDVTPPAEVVKVLYTIITKDQNANNWKEQPGLWSGSVLGSMNALQYVAGGFACWGMILVMYGFTSSAIKRTYYMIGYWIIGFFYLSNGEKNPDAAATWYKSIFGKWAGIIVMYIMFTVAGILVKIIEPAVEQGLLQLGSAGYTYGDMNLLVFFGIIFALEAAYQTAYQISQAYMGEWGARDESFQYQNPLSLLKEGQNLLNSATASAEYYGTGGPAKDAFNKTFGPNGYLEYWKKRKDSRLGREQAKWGRNDRKAAMDKKIKDGRDEGYNFKKSLSSSSKIGEGKKSGEMFKEVNPAKEAQKKQADIYEQNGLQFVFGQGGANGANAGPNGAGAGPAAYATGGTFGPPSGESPAPGGVEPFIPPAGGEPTSLSGAPKNYGVSLPKEVGHDELAQGRVGFAFANYRSKTGPNSVAVSKWYQADTFGGRLANIGRKAVAIVAEVGDKSWDIGARLARKTFIPGVLSGAVGLIGGRSASDNLDRVFGDSSQRIRRAEKNFAKAQNEYFGGKLATSYETPLGQRFALGKVRLLKDRDTGMCRILPPAPPGGGNVYDARLNNTAAQKRHKMGSSRASELGSELLY